MKKKEVKVVPATAKEIAEEVKTSQEDVEQAKEIVKEVLTEEPKEEVVPKHVREAARSLVSDTFFECTNAWPRKEGGVWILVTSSSGRLPGKWKGIRVVRRSA